MFQPIRLARWLAFAVIFGALALVLAGRTDLPRLWWYLGAMWGVMLVATFLIDVEVTKDRLKGGHKTADPVILALLRLFNIAAIVLGILDIGRLHLADTVPPALSAVGLVLMVAGFLFAFLAIRANRFFMPQVRIQTERGHRLVDTGPYRLVRHPGYAGMIVGTPAGGLALGSWLGFAFGLGAAAVFALRAAHEDAFLQKNLDGYPEYSARTRFRLVPGIW